MLLSAFYDEPIKVTFCILEQWKKKGKNQNDKDNLTDTGLGWLGFMAYQLLWVI